MQIIFTEANKRKGAKEHRTCYSLAATHKDVSKLSHKLQSLTKVSHIELADPNCNTSAQTDVLSSYIIPQKILTGVKKIFNTFLAQNNVFGWN